jgi:hypothetical protein
MFESLRRDWARLLQEERIGKMMAALARSFFIIANSRSTSCNVLASARSLFARTVNV